MAYGLIRVRELNAKEIRATDIHNARKFDENNIKYPPNIKENRSHSSSYGRYEKILYLEESGKVHHVTGFNDNYLAGEKVNTNLSDVVNARIQSAKANEKTNSVQAIEFVCSASADAFEKYDARAFFDKCDKWLIDRYGTANVVARYDHLDESTPHAHFIVVPIIQKEVKWKNRNGEGTKVENRLCAKDLTGNKKLLEKLQDDYYQFTRDVFSRYGVQIHRGTKAANQLKEYTKKTNYELGVLRIQMQKVGESIAETEKQLKNGSISREEAIERQRADEERKADIEQKFQDIEAKTEDLRQKDADKQNRRDKYNSNDGWKKGKDFTPGF